jgi:hypothetical protein
MSIQCKKRKVTENKYVVTKAEIPESKYKDDTFESDSDLDTEQMPIPQMAQTCAWCHKHVYFYETAGLYKGPNKSYDQWMVHEECNTIFNK